MTGLRKLKASLRLRIERIRVILKRCELFGNGCCRKIVCTFIVTELRLALAVNNDATALDGICSVSVVRIAKLIIVDHGVIVILVPDLDPKAVHATTAVDLACFGPSTGAVGIYILC